MRAHSITPTPWTKEEDDWIRAHYLGMDHAAMAAALGRTSKAVRNRCHRLGCRRGAEHWTDAEIQRVVDWYQAREGKPLELDDLAAQLGRLKSNVCRKARELGLSNQRRTTVEKINGRYPSDFPKYASSEERNAAIGAATKRRLIESGHPRGALGMKHTPETRVKLVQASRKGWEGMTPERLEERRRKIVETNLDRYGTANPGFVNNSNPYSRATKGYAPDIGQVFFRSMWEANYCRYLDWLKHQGEIIDWAYEADTFIFHGVTRAPVTYTPDFKVTELDGSVIYHEVKGWMDPKSKSKLKRMAKHYPHVRLIVVDEDGYKAVARSVSAIVPNWNEPLVKKDDL